MELVATVSYMQAMSTVAIFWMVTIAVLIGSNRHQASHRCTLPAPSVETARVS